MSESTAQSLRLPPTVGSTSPLLSWLLALVHVPLLADKMLHPKLSKGKSYGGRAYDLLERLMKVCLAHRITVVVVALLLLVGGLACYPFIGQSFFPDMEPVEKEKDPQNGYDFKEESLVLLEEQFKKAPESEKAVIQERIDILKKAIEKK